jgi:hypothetical protein
MPLRLRSKIAVPCWHRNYSTRFTPLKVLQDANVRNFDKDTPVILGDQFSDVPAISKWFQPKPSNQIDASYLWEYKDTIVPLEYIRLQSEDAKEPKVSSFERFEGPLSLLLNGIIKPQDPLTRLYLAQCPLEDLPADLRSHLPMPKLVTEIGRGDVYGSSLWMGMPPTMTPLHRDPNPNLFVQLSGSKKIRLMRPDAGRELYNRVRAGRGHANLRGEEMMVGDESARLEEAVWDDESERGAQEQGWEATVGAGDGLYIPLGWWHSVRGIGKRVNASVSCCSS